MKPDIHILCFNNTQYTLRTARKFKLWSPGHFLCVWDNGSTEENQEKVLEGLAGYPHLFIPLNPDPEAHRNKKVGGGKNAQLRLAIRHKMSKWAVQADNDVYLLPGWWEKTQRYIEAFPEVGVWGFYMAPNHRVVGTEDRDGLRVRYPSMLSGTICLVNCEIAEEHDIRWPEEPVDYSSHPYWHDMGGFDGVDVEFGDQFVRAGYKVALAATDLAVHLQQPGRFGGYK